MQASSSKT